MAAFQCQCCKEATLVVPEGSGPLGEICPICNWEDDFLEEDGWSSCNKSTLDKYRAKWKSIRTSLS